MKICVGYPPLESDKGTPLLSQNRQFQWFNKPTYIYPMIPAYAATLLKENGYDVVWADGIAEQLSYEEWIPCCEGVDILALETKTPVVKQHWKIIDDLKTRYPNMAVVLMGDHVTALPEESMKNSRVDFILTGGDYDFLLLSIADHLLYGNKLEPGIWYKEEGSIVNTGKFELNHDLNTLPLIDRDLTRWELYSVHNGNFTSTPGTYTMVGRDCWYHKCRFCSWTTTYPNFRTRSPESLLDEIGMLIEQYGVKSIMDDTGTFPVGQWLRTFCTGMIERGYNKKVEIHCNMRVNALTEEDYKLMGKAGFRFLLVGMESANQQTLDRLDKGIKVEDVASACKMAKEAGLNPHLTVMMGHPWETKEDAQNTINLAKHIFKKGWADTLQGTIMVPYPGTPLFDECKENGWLRTEDWDEYDMRQPIMKCPMTDEDIKELTQQLYKIFLSPNYIFRKLVSIRTMDDLKFIKRGIRSVVGHLTDFSNNKKTCD
ncbi:radical SAM protein [bacterium]|nr:radical SAM protein [bacterium]MBI9073645.1 radical SAM protein [Melioribacteraceae bacterium]